MKKKICLENRLFFYRKTKADLSMRQLSALSLVSIKTIFDIEHGIEKKQGFRKSTQMLLFNALRERVPGLKKPCQLFPVKKKIKRKKSS